MSVVNLTLTTMQAIVDHWRGEARDDFNHPFLAPIPPMLDAWAEDAKGLGDLQADSAEVKALRETSHVLDAEHDQLLGDIHAYLSGLSGLHADGDTVLALRDALMPGGRRMKLSSFQDQGVAVKAAQANLTDATRAQLERYSLPGADLLAAVERWIAVGIELQGVDAQRKSLEGQRSVLRQELRVRWLRLYKALEQGAAMSDLTEAARARLFSTVNNAS